MKQCVRRYIRATFAFMLIASALFGRTAIAEPLNLGFAMRPGMAELVSGAPVGTYLPLAAQIAKTAHVDIVWKQLPQNRLIEEARDNTPNYCAVGIYKTVERSAFAKFTQAFYHDKPLVVVAMKDKASAIRNHANFAALAADTKFTVGILDGFSYGPKLDAVIAKMAGNIDRVAGTPMQNLSKLAAGRVDYLIASSNETPRGAVGTIVDPKDLVLIEFADMAPGASRHFMCSKAVDDATIERLNTAIHTLHIP